MKSDALHDIVKKYGVPTYVYDTSVMERQYKKMQDALPQNHRIHFSCKSLTNPSVLSFFNHLGAGLDTVSINQVKLGIAVGYPPSKILFTPNGSSMQDIFEVAKLGVTICFDNLEQLEIFAQEHSNSRVFIRFNPEVLAGATANVSVGHKESKFGIHISHLPYLQKLIQGYGIKVIGLHVHSGSDIADENKLVKSIEQLFALCEYFPDIESIDLGSGFKIKYKANDVETDLVKIGDLLEKQLKKTEKEIQKKLKLIVEPGKYLVAEAGCLLLKVNLVKHSPTASFVFVNSGFNHFLRPMYYNAYHEIVNLSNTTGKKKLYNVVGYLGETDTFGWNRQLHEVNEGDILMIKNAGAYGFSMASNYNLREKPAEVLLHNGTAHLITKRETYKNLTQQSILFTDWQNVEN